MAPTERAIALRDVSYHYNEEAEVEVTEEDLDKIRAVRAKVVAMRTQIADDLLGTKPITSMMSELTKHFKR